MKFATSMTVVALAMTFVACAGFNARTGGLPTLAGTYQNIIEPVLLIGIGAEQDSGGIDAERAAELRGYVVQLGEVLNGTLLPTNATGAWNSLLPFAEAGIDARVARGEIGAGVGASLKEVLRLFGARLTQVNAPSPGQMIGFRLSPEQKNAVKVFSQ